MPLKHLPETLLVFLLGIVTVLTGALVSTLPPLAEGLLPRGLLFLLTFLYPLVLYPYFRENRADYEFRALHFAPLAIVLIAVALDLLASRFPSVAPVRLWYGWGWSLPAVVITFLLLTLFCVEVIRRRGSRLAGLAAIFAIFFVALLLDQGNYLQEYPVRNLLSALRARVGSSSSSSSLSPGEIAWREKLDAVRERSSLIAKQSSSRSSVQSVAAKATGTGTVLVRASSSSKSSIRMVASQTSKSKAPRLPSSGFDVGAIALTLAAAYCAALHDRARRRRI
jgi:hypothetical protein